MPITQAEIRDRIATDLLKKYVNTLTTQQVRDTLQGFTAPDGAQVVALIKKGNPAELGDFFLKKVLAHLKNLATTEAQSIVQDNTLSATEINRWLGDG